MNFAVNIIVGPAIWSSKAAILTLYIRLFGPKKWLRFGAYTVLVLTFLLYWVDIPVAAAIFIPGDNGSWDLAVLNRCKAIAILGPLNGATGIAADLAMLVLPLPVVIGLNMATGRKIGLAIAFLTGILYVLLKLHVEIRTVIRAEQEQCLYR